MPAPNKQNQLYFDGDYKLTQSDIDELISSDFISEKDLCDYITRNIHLFCIDILGDIYENHSREFQIETNKRGNNRRLDFLIKCENKRYAIEVKRPTFKSELVFGVGQLLSYIILCEKHCINVDKYILLTTMYDVTIVEMINKFKLPIELIVFSKSRSLTYKNGV